MSLSSDNHERIVLTGSTPGLFEAGMFPGCIYLLSMYVLGGQLLKGGDSTLSTGGTNAKKPRSGSRSSLRLQYWQARSPDFSGMELVIWTVSEATEGGVGYSFSVRHFACRCSLATLNWSSEGLATCVISSTLFFFISDFPEDVTWLTPKEKAMMKARIERDSAWKDQDSKMTLSHVVAVLTDCTPVFHNVADKSR